MCFGIWTWYFHGRQFAVQFFAGWVTEYSLSVDNLFIFVIIMASFNVPRVYQQQALFVGIVIALIFRGIFIALGAAAMTEFSWVFYIFGAFLVYTALRLVRGTDHDDDAENAVVRFARNHLNVTDTWDGLQAVVKENGKRVDDADVSGDRRAGHHRPAVRAGLHPRDLRAHPGALHGVHRQRVRADGSAAAVLPRSSDLLQRLVYLSQGLGVILVFIGVKLVLHALHENELPFINGGEHVDVPEIPTLVSLAVIVVTLVMAAAASLYATRGDARPASSRVGLDLGGDALLDGGPRAAGNAISPSSSRPARA